MSAKRKKKIPADDSGSGPNKSPKGSFNPWKSFNAWLKNKHPVLKFLLGFLGCMILFYLFYYGSFYNRVLETPFLNAQANLSNGLLHLMGHDTHVSHAAIVSDQFSVNVHKGCDGLQAMAILIAGILIFPVKFGLKIPGLLIGMGALFVLNIVRIAGLYLIGLNFSPKVFELFHLQGGFIIFTMISVIILFAWMVWAMRKTMTAGKPAAE